MKLRARADIHCCLALNGAGMALLASVCLSSVPAAAAVSVCADVVHLPLDWDEWCLVFPLPPAFPRCVGVVVFVVRSVPARVPLIVSRILAYPCVLRAPYQASVPVARAHCALCGLSKP